jgi:riboflavin kinase / FMN adenylyltransferase
MKLRRDITAVPLCHASVVSIGAFDGLHLGHQAILRALVVRAKLLGVASALVSFEPLPRSYFKQPGLLRILSVRKKIELLNASGIDYLVSLRFNEGLANMRPNDFIARVLANRLHASEVYVGADFRFGAQRAGSIATLRSAGEEFGFSVHTFADVCSDGIRVSASAVRTALLAGDFATAERLLGRPFCYRARVQTGQQLGRTLGFPTANLSWPADNPMRGIFSVRVSCATRGLDRHPAVASLGTRPVVNGVEPLLEVHLFDFTGNLYGQALTIEFVAKQRDEWHFPNLDALVVQIKLDEIMARQILGLNS